MKIGTTASQKKLFFKLRSAKAKISALENTELRPDQVASIATTLGVEDQDVVDMNRRLGGDVSLNASIRDEENSGEWVEQLVDQSPSPEAIASGASSRRAISSMSRGRWKTSRSSSRCLGSAFDNSKHGHSRKCRPPPNDQGTRCAGRNACIGIG